MDSTLQYTCTKNLNTTVEAFEMHPESTNLPVKAHWHYFMELVFVIDGTLHATVEQKEYLVKKGDLLVIYPRAIHSFDYSHADGVIPDYFVLKFDLHFLRITNTYLPKLANLLMNVSLMPEIPIHYPAEQISEAPLYNLFSACIRETEQKCYGFDLVSHSSLCLILVYIIRLIQRNGYHISNAITEEEDTPLSSILEYMDEHANEPLTVQALAKRCNMSYSYFSRSFKKYYGRSCKDYLEFIRVCKAENLLLFTSKDLNYISSETGFADCSHFIKTFKRYKQITPKQYRLRDISNSQIS